MTQDDFINLVPESDRELIQAVVMTLEVLRSMDADRLNQILCQVRLAAPLFPKQMIGAMESLEADFTLAIAFSDQARKYDRSQRMMEGFNEGPKTG